MERKKRRTLVKLFGMLAILALSAVQSPPSAVAKTTSGDIVCGGTAGCWACVITGCVVYYCNGVMDATCL